MTKEEIIKGNLEIALFMGKKPQTDGISWFDEDYKQFFYHSSWDWLIPVVEKIKDISCTEYDINFILDFTNGVELWVEGKRIYLCTAWNNGDLIKATYIGVIEFIKWYNENNSRNN